MRLFLISIALVLQCPLVLAQISNTTESSYEEDLNRATSTRGMILPRVYLVASDKLEPCVETNQVNSQSHIGLTVYNMTESADLKKGVYVWQGEEWLALMNDAPLGLGGWNDVETHEAAVENRGDTYHIGSVKTGADMNSSDVSLMVNGNTSIEKVSKKTQRASILTLGTLASPGLSPDINADKGILIPRVVLNTSTSLDCIDTNAITDEQKAKYKGTLVYHVGGMGIKTGLKMWDGKQWLICVTDVDAVEDVRKVSKYMLLHDVKAEARSSPPGKYGISGAFVPFGVKNEDDVHVVKIEEAGSYAFTVNMHAKVMDNTAAGRVIYYFLLYKRDGETKEIEQQDQLEINQAITSAPGFNFTYTATLGAPNLKKGDEIFFIMQYYSPSNFPSWQFNKETSNPLVPGTYMFMWKL